MWPSESDKPQKLAFAAQWLRMPENPFKAALQITGQLNAGMALKIAAEWINDPIVLAERDRLLAEKGESHFLPDKFETARKALTVFETAPFTDDRLKALKLYVDIMGFIPKDESGNNNGKMPVMVLSETDRKL